jgi:hypothetical protein
MWRPEPPLRHPGFVIEDGCGAQAPWQRAAAVGRVLPECAA